MAMGWMTTSLTEYIPCPCPVHIDPSSTGAIANEALKWPFSGVVGDM
jgi:hypothetical protein